MPSEILVVLCLGFVRGENQPLVTPETIRYNGKGNRLTKLLGVLFSPKIDAAAKIDRLEQEFEIPMEEQMGEELNQMCNLSDYVVKVSLQEGREQGKEQLLMEQVMKKHAKGKSAVEIADALETDEETVRNILRNAGKP
ncbi:MAG TPA: hypothetical protein H9799_09710 [Candidatus Mediterraneibacter merdipullorum]|nr:hypothetical protein [Candidatus Mediterraneibacter merdipullorum]